MDATDPATLLVSARQRRLEGAEPPHTDGGIERVRRGYYRPAGDGLSTSQLYRLRIHATLAARTEQLVFSHVSAAELWGCPLLAVDTPFVHATRPGKARRTSANVRMHRARIPDGHVLELEDGMLVTSPAWTAVQVAAASSLPNVLLPLDHLLARLNSDPIGDPPAVGVVEELLALVPIGMRGADRARRHLHLADARSGSAGESLSRGQMELLRVPRPDLQTRLPRPDGVGDDIVDFDWPRLATFGEFDGNAKYFSPDLTAGRNPRQVLWDEKEREDRVRRHRPRGIRWGWDVAMARERLGAVLAAGGVRPGTR